ncbi:MAG: methyl-accepting chemotaxis protein [Thermodesulfobacteriota bacterium]|nr:methyl-accepting chemotaxis protein [Thermodesulfobacteriota bacterium]
MNNIKMGLKIFILSGLIVLVFTAAISWIYSQARTSFYQAKHAEIQHAVESVWGIVDHFAQQEAQGTLAREQAQQLAMNAVKSTRFAGDNYFWINDLQPTMVMHPLSPELDGKNLSGNKDPNGKALFVEMARVARESSEGFVDYQWAKPGFKKPVDKVSFVKLVPEWGWIVGAGLYLDDMQAALGKILWTAIAVVATAIAGILVLVTLMTRSITGPLNKTVRMLQELGRGHLSNRLHLERKDEIGQMAKAMDEFAENMQKEIVTPLRKLAEGDLDFEIRPYDDQDVLRGAMKKVGDDLNDIMGRIQSSGTQISGGANQVADTSQSLSQGATEQASSLEEIAASMNEMASQISMSADNAQSANDLSGRMKQAATEGSARMRQMMAAMDEVNEAGQNVSKIIKVIEEIAFQTNLLALNAAVEAARAGQHGKGFAVVAEEVRNLAARSAKAATETSQLIEGSVAKSANAGEIASQTETSLEQMVAEVTKVSDLVSEIAAAAREQAEGIGQVNQGLGQIDQVTQQNTANAEESAAAAEELSSQAENLRQMLARFTLRQQQTARIHSKQSVSRHETVNHQIALGWGENS